MGWTKVKTASKTITIEEVLPRYPEVTAFSMSTDKTSYKPGDIMNITFTVTLSKAKYNLIMYFIVKLNNETLKTTNQVSQEPNTTKSYIASVTVPQLSAGTYTLTAECWAYYPEQPGP